MVFFVASAKLFAEFPRVWMPFTWIPLQYIHISHLESSPYPSGLGCIIYCLAGENGELVVKTPQPHSWMKLAALRANSHVRTRKLSNFDRRKSKHLNGFLCIHFRLAYKCFHIIDYYLIKLYRLLSLYEENTNLRWNSQLIKTAKPVPDECNTLSYLSSFWSLFALKNAKSYNNVSYP